MNTHPHWSGSILNVVLGAALLACVSSCARTGESQAVAQATPTPAQQVFEARIMPIFNSPNPSSCTQCHLSAVDLKNYILPSHEKTFLSLRDQGLVNLDRPTESKILRLIKMGEEDKGAKLISRQARQQEYEAFSEWIKACCADPKLRTAAKLAAAELAQPKRPDEVIRHARIDKVLQSFEENVWSQRFRCTGCHLAGQGDNAKLVAKFGEKVNWIKREGPEATMRYLISTNLLDTITPEKSMLLRKPLMDGVEHGGGKKMLPGDLGYKGFRTWLEDYAAIREDQYAKSADLPKLPATPQEYESQHWVKLENTPAAWADRLLQISVHAWDARKNAWEAQPIAVSDRGVFGKGSLWQHNLILLADKGSERAKTWSKGRASLPPGRYQVRVQVDLQGRLAKEWKSQYAAADYVGQVVLTQQRWPEGYGSMTVINASQVRK